MVIILKYAFILFDIMMKDKEGIKGTTLLFCVFLASMTLGTLLMFLLDKREEREICISHTIGEHSSVRSVLKSAVAPLQDKRMLLTIPLLVYSGLQQAYVW